MACGGWGRGGEGGGIRKEAWEEQCKVLKDLVSDNFFSKMRCGSLASRPPTSRHITVFLSTHPRRL